MKQLYSSIFLFFFCFSGFLYGQDTRSAITYHSWPRRLGDNLLLYIKAKWLSYHFNITLLYKPFKHSDRLMLHKKELQWNENYKKKFEKIITLKNVPQNIDPNQSILYQVDYYIKNIPHWEIIKDAAFLNIIKDMIAPAFKPLVLPLPKDKHCIALHMRKGGCFDKPLFSQQIYTILSNKRHLGADQIHPLKFPPDQYYLDQILKLSEILHDEPMYIYLFTDDSQPQNIINRFKKYLNKSNITFDCRQKDNHHSKHIVEDLFAITQFDYYIRGNSYFSQMADIIGTYKIVILPKKYIWEDNKLIITEVTIKTNEN